MKTTILTVVSVLTLGGIWVHEYVAPKTATLEAAVKCLHKEGFTSLTKEAQPVWEVCRKGAEAKYATKTLLAVGY